MTATLLLLVLSLSSFASSAPSDPFRTEEIAALLAVKGAVAADPSALLSGWDPSATDHCAWRGVTCTSGRVTAVNLTAGSLAGTIPAAIGALRHLQLLDLSRNNFSGDIPGEISYLPSLRVLDLSRNSLSGSIPSDLIGFSRLESVDLSFNQLSGDIQISPSGSCQSLVHLKLSENLLVNRIPPEIGKCSKMQILLLDHNILEGPIPAEIGRMPGLRALDVSRNSLTDRIPRELGGCHELSVLVLTNLTDLDPTNSLPSVILSADEEFNAFVGPIPPEIFAIPNLESLWAPRANLEGRLPSYRNDSCSLRILNLGQNYIGGVMPEWIGTCQNLTFLDLSSNNLQGPMPASLGVRCMVYFNVSRNLICGSVTKLSEAGCSSNILTDRKNTGLLEEDILIEYFNAFLQSVQKDDPLGSMLDDHIVVLHDFSWNSLSGPLPTFSLSSNSNFSYGLLLNNNAFNGSVSSDFFAFCQGGGNAFTVNLSVNQISGSIDMLSSCLRLKSFEATDNQLSGPISPGIQDLHLLELLALSGNNLSCEIPDELGDLASLAVLDLSRNSLSGSIPSSLSNASNLEVLLLDHNRLSGRIPLDFSMLVRLVTLDVSFNNLSGDIPYLRHSSDCKFFVGNPFLNPCLDSNASAPSGIITQDDIPKSGSRTTGLKSFAVAAVASASVVVSILLVLFRLVVRSRRKHARIASLRRKVVMTFNGAPAELTYDNVVSATGNFSIQNLIGAGGFGATYKAELVPGYLLAVKRLSMGRFQGLQQFDAEIRTLGRIRHKNLVTLIGYHMGEADTFLIYNYLCGGNLETFIRNMPSRKASWLEMHKIALDVAQALSYLHNSCAPRIVHRDIKPSNILLDENLNAFLSDFGLARLLEVSQTHATTDVAGTFGYVAPEYATTCRVSHKADVYSFGVVLMELMSGKRSLDPSFADYGNGFTIVTWGRMLIQEEHAAEFFCPGLWDAGPKDKLVEMLRIALSCTVETLSIRPSMKQVVMALKQLKNQ